jgi:hypothetical protein
MASEERHNQMETALVGGLAGLQEKQPQRQRKSRINPLRTAICDQCGATFTTRRKNKIRCSWDCVEMYLVKRDRKPKHQGDK